MTWFWLALATLFFWSGSDLFSKIGCRDGKDKYGHLKMVIAVGFVMGIHALIEIIGGVEISWQVMLTYLPVSLLYILSMALAVVVAKDWWQTAQELPRVLLPTAQRRGAVTRSALMWVI